MRTTRYAYPAIHHRGLSLVELLVATVIGAVLLLGLVQIAAAARSTFRLQEAIAEVQENGRFVIDSLGDVLRQSGFAPAPWEESVIAIGLTNDTDDAVRAQSDRIAFRTWSDRNCFDNFNPLLDGAGAPAFYLKESILELNGSANLAHTCRYGPAPEAFVTQILNQGLVQNVEAFQALYAEDVDTDGQADQWVPGGEWLNEHSILGVQLAILLRSNEAVTEARTRSFSVLDEVITPTPDGRLRQVYTIAHSFRGRSE